MAQHTDVADDLLPRSCGSGPCCNQARETTRLKFQPLDALEEIERTQRGCGAHCGINQHENCDDRALVIFIHEVQAVIDQREKNKIREKPIGVAQDFHASWSYRSTARSVRRA